MVPFSSWKRWVPHATVGLGAAWWLIQILDAIQILSSTAESLGGKGPVIVAVIQTWAPPVILIIGFSLMYLVGRKEDLHAEGHVEEDEAPPEEEKPEGPGVAGQDVEFYPDQNAMLADGWGIKEALANPDVTEMRMAFESAHFYNGLLDAAIKQKVSRVTLVAPGSKWLDNLYNEKPKRLGYAQESIKRAWDKSEANEIEVKLVECPDVHCVIAYKEDGGGWARAQLVLTSEESDWWPSVVVDRVKQPGLFRRIEAAFERQFLLGADEWPTDEDVLGVLPHLPHNAKVTLDSLLLEPRQLMDDVEREYIDMLREAGLVEIVVPDPTYENHVYGVVPSHKQAVADFFDRTINDDGSVE